jgi:putative tryptophan/tyrosine transport system substrate-binding protein
MQRNDAMCADTWYSRCLSSAAGRSNEAAGVHHAFRRRGRCLAARGACQQVAKKPIIGLLGSTTPSVENQRVAGFVQRLGELGWIEGRNIVIEYRWAAGRNERYKEIAAEFARLGVDVIVTQGTTAIIAAKQATSNIPIVFAAANDPVATGIVASLARPGGNVTGVSSQAPDTAPKRLQFLREVVPAFGDLGIIVNIGNSGAVLELHEVQAAATTLGLKIVTLEIRRAEDIARAFETLRGHAQALYICVEPLVNSNRDLINTLALGARLPTMYGIREYIEAGGLISYGQNVPDQYRRAAELVDKILRGMKPADIPVEQPTKFELVINLKTAKALDLKIPPTLLMLADEVIE